ncbi:MAG: DUF6036 family nucleotidyltransferase [Rhodoglobus sp.]
MSIVEEFFCEIDERGPFSSGGRPRLHLIGSCALMLQADYERGTKDSDVFQTIDLSRQLGDRLLAIAGKGTELHRRRRIYLEIVGNGLPFLPWPPLWRPARSLANRLIHLDLHVLDAVDVVVSKLKRLNENDLADIAAMIDLELVPHRLLVERFRSAVDAFSGDARASDLPTYVANLHRVERDMVGADETEIALPSWI